MSSASTSASESPPDSPIDLQTSSPFPLKKDRKSYSMSADSDSEGEERRSLRIEPGEEETFDSSDDEFYKRSPKRARRLSTSSPLSASSSGATTNRPSGLNHNQHQPGEEPQHVAAGDGPEESRPKPLRSFLIEDILSHKSKRSHSSLSTNSGQPTEVTTNSTPSPSATINNNPSPVKIVRPWDSPARSVTVNGLFPTNTSHGHHHHHHQSHHNLLRHHSLSPKVNGLRPRSADEDTRSEASSDLLPESPANGGLNTHSSPLDALFELTNKAFDGLDQDKSGEGTSEGGSNAGYGSNSNSKKKRKSRTAFTNNQIFELEKRFLYQKYLSPADRDELALGLGLSNAQVITWFQNRRAKLKRDVEELKKDMEATKINIHTSPHMLSAPHLSLAKHADLAAVFHLNSKK